MMAKRTFTIHRSSEGFTVAAEVVGAEVNISGATRPTGDMFPTETAAKMWAETQFGIDPASWTRIGGNLVATK